MLNLVEVRNSAGDLLNLQFDDVTDGLIVEEIDGLDPVKATLVSSAYAQQDGAQYHSGKREPRNIIFKIGLEPDYVDVSVKNLRDQLYGFFMPKTEVDLRFIMSETLTVTIRGIVESFVSTLFTAEPQVTISVMCFDPDFLKLGSTVVSQNTTHDTSEVLIAYDGTVETGFIFSLFLNRSLSDFTIYHRLPTGVIKTLDFASSLITSDLLTINTITGSKGAVLTRSSIQTSLLYGVSAQSSWLELMPGNNYIRVYAVGAAIPYELSYIKRYGGL